MRIGGGPAAAEMANRVGAQIRRPTLRDVLDAQVGFSMRAEHIQAFRTQMSRHGAATVTASRHTSSCSALSSPGAGRMNCATSPRSGFRRHPQKICPSTSQLESTNVEPLLASCRRGQHAADHAVHEIGCRAGILAEDETWPQFRPAGM